MFSLPQLYIRKIVYICGTLVLAGIAPSNAQAMADFALGGHNICSIDTNGSLECTTRFNPNTYLPPNDGTLYTAVVSGGAHTCAITQQGDIRCWGLNNFGQSTNIPTSAVAFTSLSAGENHTCALDANGQAYCWGLNSNGQVNVPTTNNQGFSTIHTGALGSCGIRASGETVCWSTSSNYATLPLLSNTWTDLVFPSEGSVAPACGLNNEGFIDCWGTHSSLATPSNGPYTQIESSGIFFCGLKTDGDLDCTVFNFLGTTPTNSINMTTLAEIEALPPLVDFQVRSSGPSLNSLCGLDFDGELHCAGNGLPADNLPGEQLNVPAPFNLSFSVYSDNAGELFWLSDVGAIRSPVSGYRVFRNGELLRFSAASSSYFDDDLQPNMSYTYEVSIELADGTQSQISESITISTAEVGQAPSNSSNSPDYLLQGMTLTRYSALTLELFWERPGNTSIDRYDVFRNGEYLTSTPGPSYFDDTVEHCGTYEYTVAAVSNEGQVVALGFQSEGTFPLITCP